MMVTRQPAGQALDGPLPAVSSSDVISMLRQFRERTHSLVEDLDDRQLIGPRLRPVPGLFVLQKVFDRHPVASISDASLFAGVFTRIETLYPSISRLPIFR